MQRFARLSASRWWFVTAAIDDPHWATVLSNIERDLLPAADRTFVAMLASAGWVTTSSTDSSEMTNPKTRIRTRLPRIVALRQQISGVFLSESQTVTGCGVIRVVPGC